MLTIWRLPRQIDVGPSLERLGQVLTYGIYLQSRYGCPCPIIFHVSVWITDYALGDKRRHKITYPGTLTSVSDFVLARIVTL